MTAPAWPDVEPDTFLAFAQAAIAVRTADDFCALVRWQVRPLLPHEMMVAATVRLNFDTAEVHQILSVDFPEDFIRTLRTTVNLRDRPVAAAWAATRAPVYADMDDIDRLTDLQRQEARRYGLKIIAAHGVLDVSSSMGSYFSFARVAPDWKPERITGMLRLITPHLHQAWLQVSDLPVLVPSPLARLTATELELLSWLSAGRTNREIAQLRGRSPATVRNQIEVMYRKLGVGNRAEAARIAATLGVSTLTNVGGLPGIRPAPNA